MTNAFGRVALSIPAVSALLPSMCRMLKLGGKSLSASRRSPPWRSVAGFCGLMSLLVPSEAFPEAECVNEAAAEHPDNIRAPTSRALTIPRTPRLVIAGLRLRYRTKQSTRVLVLRIAEHLLAVTLLDHRAAIHHDHLVRKMLDH